MPAWANLEQQMPSIFVTIAFVLLALLGAPLFIVILASALWATFNADIGLQAVPMEIYRLAETPVLAAIPFFTFAGFLLGKSRAPQRLINLSGAFLGQLPGNLAIVAIISCALFTAFTGASGITIIALGSLLYPALYNSGYSEKFSLGLITSSGSLGLLFAPSMPLILYAVVAQQMQLPTGFSIDDLFTGGAIPGILMLLALSIYGIWQRPKNATNQKTNQEPKQGKISALLAAKWELPLPFVIVGGIYGGLFAISDAAAITALYTLLVVVFIRREVSFKQLPTVIAATISLVGAILIILGVSLASTNVLLDQQVPQQLFAMIKNHIDNKYTFLILLTLFLLLLGMLLDIFSAIVIMVPIILPIAVAYGIHPVHLGILFLANMQLGYFTPPVGMNLFIASLHFKRPVLQLYRATLPFFAILLLCVLCITFIPALSTMFI